VTAPTAPGPEVRAQRLVELTLAVLTMAAVLGLARLFEGASFFTAVLAFAALGHGLALLCRARRLSGTATAVVGVGGLVLGVSWFLLPQTTAYLVPTPATLGAVGERLADAWDVFSSVRAPAPVHPGLVLAAAVATYVIAWVADTAAFRASAPVEAAIPATSLFLFGAALGAPPLRAPTTAVFLAAVLAYWLATRAWRSTSSPSWAGHQDGGAAALLGSGSRLAGVAVLAAVVLGPLVPGAGSAALVPWRASDRDSGTRLTVSPLVDIRTRIVDQAEVEVFTVRSASRSYWRLTALDEFDGRIWRSDGRFSSVDRELADPGEVRPRNGSTVVDQQVEISGLEAVWLPAAYRPVAFEARGVRVGVDKESSTLIIGRHESSEGLRYRVQSLVRQPTEDDLRLASLRPRRIARLYTTLPLSFSPAARELAQAIVAGRSSPYDAARALQDHFRTGAYRYDTSVEPGHGEDDLERFLLETRAGYCEQFAGAYAALARAVGLPARVAVGFTPGELEADGSYHVRGSHGHAWPEVFLGSAGWVPFEPTPGRGIPGGEGYTGVPEEQAGPDGDQSAATTTTSTSTTLAGGAPTTAPPGRALEDPGAARAGERDPSPWPGRLAWTALALTGAAVVELLLVVLATWVRRTRRRRAARTTSGRVLVAWDEVGEALTAAGVPARPAETPLEYAARAAGEAGVDPGRLRSLAVRVTEAGWAADAMDEDEAVEAVAAAAAVEGTLHAARSRGERLRWAVDPRPLLPRRAGRVQIRELPAH